MSRMTSMALVGAVCVALLLVAAPAAAQDDPPAAPLLMKDGTLIAHLLDLPTLVIEPPRGARPPILPVLYASFVGLEVYDGYSTSRGLADGATEGNALVRWAVGNPATLWAVKGGAAAASIYLAERLWTHHHRAQAIAVMVASNALMAAVAAGNLSVLRAQR